MVYITHKTNKKALGLILGACFSFVSIFFPVFVGAWQVESVPDYSENWGSYADANFYTISHPHWDLALNYSYISSSNARSGKCLTSEPSGNYYDNVKWNQSPSRSWMRDNNHWFKVGFYAAGGGNSYSNNQTPLAFYLDYSGLNPYYIQYPNPDTDYGCHFSLKYNSSKGLYYVNGLEGEYFGVDDYYAIEPSTYTDFFVQYIAETESFRVSYYINDFETERWLGEFYFPDGVNYLNVSAETFLVKTVRVSTSGYSRLGYVDYFEYGDGDYWGEMPAPEAPVISSAITSFNLSSRTWDAVSSTYDIAARVGYSNRDKYTHLKQVIAPLVDGVPNFDSTSSVISARALSTNPFSYLPLSVGFTSEDLPPDDYYLGYWFASEGNATFTGDMSTGRAWTVSLSTSALPDFVSTPVPDTGWQIGGLDLSGISESVSSDFLVSQYEYIINTISSKFPFSWVYEFFSVVGSVTYSPESFSDYDIVLTGSTTVSNLSYDFKLVDFSGVQSQFSDIWDNIRGISSVFIYLSGVMFLIAYCRRFINYLTI